MEIGDIHTDSFNIRLQITRETNYTKRMLIQPVVSNHTEERDTPCWKIFEPGGKSTSLFQIYTTLICFARKPESKQRDNPHEKR